MNPETPRTPREEIEVRLTAMLMGELSPDEATALQSQMAGDPELTALHARLRHAIELLREASALPEQSSPPVPAQLSVERRARLLEHFKVPTPPRAAVVVKPKQDWKTFVPLGLAALLIAMIGVAMLFPAVSALKESPEKLAMAPRSVRRLSTTDSSADVDSNGRTFGAGASGTRWAFEPAAAPSKHNVNTASEGARWDESPDRADTHREGSESIPRPSLAQAAPPAVTNGAAFEAEGRVRGRRCVARCGSPRPPPLLPLHPHRLR